MGIECPEKTRNILEYNCYIQKKKDDAVACSVDDV